MKIEIDALHMTNTSEQTFAISPIFALVRLYPEYRK